MILTCICVFLFGIYIGALMATKMPKCPHDWQLVDKVEFPPLIVDIEAHGYAPPPGNGRADLNWFRRKIHLAIKCVKCGALEMKKLES